MSLDADLPYLSDLRQSAHKEWEALSELGELIEPESKNREDFLKECTSGRLDGVVAAYRSFASVSVTGHFDEELCKVLPKSWKYLGICGKPSPFVSILEPAKFPTLLGTMA